MSWLWLATCHKDWLWLTGIGSSESGIGASDERVAVGANARDDDIVSRLNELLAVRTKRKGE